jgi:pyruvate kinase
VSTDETMNDIKSLLKSKEVVLEDDLVINIASMPITQKGMTNMLKLSRIE